MTSLKKMESLPIRYFDKHTHGELMSLYTNDTDAIREMLSNSVAQFISSAITIVGVFTAMLIYSWQLTIIVIAMLLIILRIIGCIGSRSGKGFIAQQNALGKRQRLHRGNDKRTEGSQSILPRGQTCEEFDRLNEQLCRASTRANTFANILMPIMNNLSYLHYAITAIAGGIMAVKGIGNMTVVQLVISLQFTRRSFAMPITQVHSSSTPYSQPSQAQRIFAVIDEEPEASNT